MKKFILSLSFVSLSFGVYSAPIGNAAVPGLVQEGFVISSDSWVDCRIGYEGDFVADGRMKQTILGSLRVDTFQQYTNAATVTLNVLDRLDLFGIFGSSRICADWRYEMANQITRIQLETLYHYLWGVGGRGIFFEWGKVCLSLGGRYASSHYKPSWLETNGAAVSVAGTHLNWRQWQIDFDLSYNIDLFTPYFGLKYSNAQAKLGVFPVAISRSGTGTNQFENRVPLGIVIGCSISNGKYFMLNVEGRFVDEDAVTISGDLRF